jgi:hypothetical protein
MKKFIVGILQIIILKLQVNLGHTHGPVDRIGTPLEIGDVVYFRAWEGHPFNNVGVVKSSAITGNCIDIMFNTIIVRKFPENICKMPDEQALLWKLEN